MNTHLLQNLLSHFQRQFGDTELSVFSPGRINLIGEHTDYNEGFVLPAAVNLGIYAAFRRSDKPYSEVLALDLKESFQFDVKEVNPLPNGAWRNYLLGAVHFLQEKDDLPGQFQVAFAGDVPLGSGMSSSAALENAISFGLNELFELDLDRVTLAKVGQLAEHHYVGVNCGIMDQFSSMLSNKDHALLLDCQSLSYDLIPLNLQEYKLVLINSKVQHSLASSEYNVRRAQCDEGLLEIQKSYPGVGSLRDVTPEVLQASQKSMSDVVYRRCQYVLEENQRVLDFAKSVKSNNLTLAGMLLRQSQEGMRYQYEITCEEIDFLADFANNYQGVLGSRMMGGGFGGCTINLLHHDVEQDFILDVSKAYQEKFDRVPEPISFEIGDGTRRL